MAGIPWCTPSYLDKPLKVPTNTCGWFNGPMNTLEGDEYKDILRNVVQAGEHILLLCSASDPWKKVYELLYHQADTLQVDAFIKTVNRHGLTHKQNILVLYEGEDPDKSIVESFAHHNVSQPG